MRATRFLADRERDANRERDREDPARHAPRAVAEREVETEQREARRCVRARKALRACQGIGAIGKQRDVGIVAAEVREVCSKFPAPGLRV